VALSGLLLVDKSALVRLTREDLERRSEEPCLCAVTRFEVLFSARSPEEYLDADRDLSTFRDLRMDAETFAIATLAQRELAARSQHRVSVPDLLISACAQQHGADVLHVDRHFDVLADVLSFRSLPLA